MDRYLGFALNALQSLWSYRFRMAVWILGDFVVLGVQYFLWTAIFDASGGRLFSVEATRYLSYVALCLVVARFNAGDIDGDIAQEIKTGDIAMSLIKPVDYFAMATARRLGMLAGNLAAMVPLLLVILPAIGLPPLDPATAAAGLLAVVLGWILSTIFLFLVGILAFWITNYWGLFLFKRHIIALFSGELVALNLLFQFGSQGLPNLPLPGLDQEALRGLFTALGILSYCLPFQAMSYTPSGLLTGMIVGPDRIALHLGLQVFWIACLGALARLLWGRAQRRIAVLGG